jgi:hypothetical protein
MQVPSVAGQPSSCIAVGHAFATAWSRDVASVAVKAISGATGSGAPVHLVFSLTRGAVSDAATMKAALARKVTVVVIAQGVDVGTVVIGKPSLVTLTVAPLIATFLREQLLPHQHT